MNQTGILNLQWAQLIVEELRRQGVGYFCVCPGSRSSPLALAVAQEHRVRRIVHFDERGAAYHALGYARGSGKPAAVIGTSGTAAANFLPAVVEASMDSVPLIVITADRPPELRQCGANQTIDQVRLYGDYARFFADLPCPEADIDPAYVLSTVDQAVARAHGPAPGPVHLNCMFREPLVPEELKPKPYDPRIAAWCESHSPWTERLSPPTAPGKEMVAQVVARIAAGRRCLVLVGRLRSPAERDAALALIERLGWPALADTLSGLRTLSHDLLISHHSLALAAEPFRQKVIPDTIIQIGTPPVSRAMLQFAEECRAADRITIAPPGAWPDPSRTARLVLEGDVAACCRELTAECHATPDRGYLDLWKKASRAVTAAVEDICSRTPRLTGCALVRDLTRRAFDGGLFLASSLSIRDFDWYADTRPGTPPVAANRGASGIDGTIAAAAGFAAGLDRPVTLLIGDQAFLHDLNSLALLGKTPNPVTVVVANNGGGRIFELLPVAEHKAYLDEYFVACHDLRFDKVAATFGLDYAQVDSAAAFAQALETARQSGRSSVIEALIDPQADIAVRRQIGAKVAQKLAAL